MLKVNIDSPRYNRKFD